MNLNKFGNSSSLQYTSVQLQGLRQRMQKSAIWSIQIQSLHSVKVIVIPYYQRHPRQCIHWPVMCLKQIQSIRIST